MKEEKTKGQVQPMEIPSIKKVVHCPKCKAKIEVEFEIGLDMIMPMLGGASLPIVDAQKEKDK